MIHSAHWPFLDLHVWERASTSTLEASMAKPGAESKKCLMFDSITDFDSGGAAAAALLKMM
jgi:hypothetical protein